MCATLNSLEEILDRSVTNKQTMITTALRHAFAIILNYLGKFQSHQVCVMVVWWHNDIVYDSLLLTWVVQALLLCRK